MLLSKGSYRTVELPAANLRRNFLIGRNSQPQRIKQTMFQGKSVLPFLLKNINYGHSATCTGSENVIMIVFELFIAKLEM